MPLSDGEHHCIIIISGIDVCRNSPPPGLQAGQTTLFSATAAVERGRSGGGSSGCRSPDDLNPRVFTKITSKNWCTSLTSGGIRLLATLLVCQETQTAQTECAWNARKLHNRMTRSVLLLDYYWNSYRWVALVLSPPVVS